MTDDSWLEAMLREKLKSLVEKKECIKEETQRLREENEALSKINVKEQFGHLSDGFLLNENEIDDLRKSKRELSQYGKEKIRELINMKLLEKFNDYCNFEFSSMPHGMPISYEHLEAIAIRGAIHAFGKESISKEELNNLADLIEKQGDRTVQEVSDVHRRRDLDTL
jgi:hypothetical protein